MRKTVLTILASVFLFSATELHQLVKLPGLVSHLKEHRESDPSMSIWAFLQLHYTADHPADNDDDDDNQLPFKDLNAIGHLDAPLSVARAEQRNCPVFLVVNTPISHPEGIPQHRAFAVFHPPKA